MDNDTRLYSYAFLSRVMADIPDARFIKDLKANERLMSTIGEGSMKWLLGLDDMFILDELNSDFTSLFVLNTQPIESFVLDAKNEAQVGLQNPAMGYYFKNNFDLNMDQTSLMAPDHLSIEFAFMQALVFRDEKKSQREFLEQHLIPWVVPYMVGMKGFSTTPFYQDICDFIVEFLIADYNGLMAGAENGSE
jgi:TorA maturation chaperone TorD